MLRVTGDRAARFAFAAALCLAASTRSAHASETYVQLVRPTFATVAGYGWATSYGNYHGLGLGGAFGFTFAFNHDPRSAGLWFGANLVFHHGTTHETPPTATRLSAGYFAPALGAEWFIGRVLVRPNLQIGYQWQSRVCVRGEFCDSKSGTLGYIALGSLIAVDFPLRDVESPRALRVGIDLRAMRSTSAMWGYPAPRLDTSTLALYLVGEAAL